MSITTTGASSRDLLERISARVCNVTARPIGDVLAESASAGDTVLTVRDASDFDPDGGQLRLVDPDDDTGAGVLLTYVTIDDDDLTGANGSAEPDEGDEGFDTITLSAPLVGDFAIDSTVQVWDAEFAVVATDYEAQVESAEYTGDADIAHALIDKLGPGVRGLIGEAVTVDLVDDDAVIVGVWGKQPITDGSFIPPDTLPTAEVPLPEASPDPTVETGPGGIVVSWPDQGPGLMVDVHVSLASAGDIDVDGTTLNTAAAGQPCFIYTLSAGTGEDAAAGQPLPAEEDVQVALVVRNSAGLTAEPSPWVPGRAGQIPEQFMLLLAGTILAKRLTGEVLEGTTIRGSILDIFGSFYAGPDGATFKGSAELVDAVFRGNVTWGGLVNWLLGTLTLTAGVPDPTTPPSLGYEWDPPLVTEIMAEEPRLAPTVRGLCQSLAISNHLVTVHVVGYVGTGVRIIRKDTGASGPPIADISSWSPNFYAEGGITELGGSYYVLGRDYDRSTDWYVYQLNDEYVKTAEWKWVNASALADGYTPAIGNNGTNLLIAYTNSANAARVQVRTTAGVQVGSVVDLAGLGRTIFAGVGVDPAGGWWVARRNGTALGYSTAGARATSRDVARAGGTNVLGMRHDGTVLQHLDDTGRVWTYSTHPGGSFDYAWSKYDGDPGGDGLAESKPSPRRTSSAVPRGARPVINIPAIDAPATDDSPDRGIVYAATAAGILRQQATYEVGETSRSFDHLVTTSGTQPKTVSEFAERLSTALGTWRSELTASDDLPLSWADGKGGGRALKQRQSGRKSLTVAAADTVYTEAITFLEPFDVIPVVHPVAQNVNTLGSVELNATDITETGFTLRYSRTAATNFVAGWTADAPTQ